MIGSVRCVAESGTARGAHAEKVPSRAKIQSCSFLLQKLHFGWTISAAGVVEIDAGDANPLDVELSIPHSLTPKWISFIQKNSSTNIRVSGGVIYLISVSSNNRGDLAAEHFNISTASCSQRPSIFNTRHAIISGCDKCLSLSLRAYPSPPSIHLSSLHKLINNISLFLSCSPS
jgi:hypothetical protein